MFRRILLLAPALALTVAWADPVAHTAKAPSPDQVYLARLRETSGTAQAHAALARWCRTQGLEARAREQWLEVIRLDPEFVEARAALGYRKVAGVWMSEADYKAMQEAKSASASPSGTPDTVEGRMVGWTADHQRLIVEAARNGAVNLDTRYIRVGVPLVTLELRPTMAQLIGIRTVFTSGAITTGTALRQNNFVECPITQMSSVRTTASAAAYR